MNYHFRRLLPEEIQAKVKVDKGGGRVMLLLYKDARADMSVLDECVGPMNWKRSHQGINNNMFCTVELWDEDKQCWVAKCDAGAESAEEKEKGEASDSFKRACVNWGIGRELYTSPNIWVEVKDDDYYVGGDNKKRMKTRFSVAKIEYDDRGNITYLMLEDQKGLKRFEYGRPNGGAKPVKKPEPKKEPVIAQEGKGTQPTVEGADIPYDPKDAYNRLCNVKPKEQVNALLKAEHIGNFSDITPAIFKDLLIKLGRLKPFNANDGGTIEEPGALDDIPFGG